MFAQTILVAWFLISTAATILLIGKPREPLSPPVAAVAAVINALLIWAVLSI